MDQDPLRLALQATQALRQSPAAAQLESGQRESFAHDLARIESVLRGGSADPYAMVLATPADFQRSLVGGTAGAGRTGGAGARAGGAEGARTATPAARRPQATEVIGGRVADTLDSVDFPAFVAGLVTGTFQAIVDSTSQQLREYADLVRSLAQTVDQFSRDNVSVGQTRDYLSNRHRGDLALRMPAAGATGEPKLVPQPDSDGGSPEWLAEYGLEGEALTEELSEGPLMDAGRRVLGQDRMRSLATMLLLGSNRVVVDQGQIKARMQFHAVARDRTSAEVMNVNVGGGGDIATRQIGASSAGTAMVSTVKANAQSDAAIRADLMGEVNLQFSTESFPIERFAEPEVLDALMRHSNWRKGEPAAQEAPAPAAAAAPVATPAPAPVAAPAPLAPQPAPAPAPAAAPPTTPTPEGGR